MSKSKLLDDYLAGMRASGEIDSEGVFTVAGTRAVGKLAAFLLHKPSDWVLKMVQAACACNAPELHLNQTRSSTQAFFRTDYALDLAHFEQCLTSATQKAAHRGFEHLATALRAVGVGQDRQWIARLTVSDQVSVISYFDGAVSAQRTQTQELVLGTVVEIGVAYPPGEAGKLGGLVRFGEAIQEEHMALLSRCRACPIPLFLDGLRIDDLAEPSITTVLEARAFLGVLAPTPSGGESIVVPGGLREHDGSFKLEDRFNPHSPFLVSTSGTRARSLQRWFYNYTTSKESTQKTSFHFNPVEAPSRVYLVRDGVVVGKKNLGVNHPISADVFINADALRSDLSGLQVSPTSVEEEFAKREIREALPFLDRLSAELQPHRPRPLKHQMMLYGGLGALGLFMPALSLKAAAGVVSTVLLANSAKNQRAVVEAALSSLDEFRSRIKSRN